MPLSTRIFFMMTLASVLTSVAVLVVPDLGGLGAAPKPDDAIVWLTNAATQPVFLVPFGLAVVLFAWNQTRPLAESRIRSVSTLAPFAVGLSKLQKLEATRTAFAAQSPAADGLVLAELMVHAGVRAGASDIHLHPLADGATINLRIDGALEPLGALTLPQYGVLLNRLKVLGRLTHYVTDRPQDGQFNLLTPDGNAEVRISLLPTQHGEKAVMRLAGLGNKGPSCGRSVT